MAANRGRHLFLGSNTWTGFVGFYEGMRQRARRTVILKGGPGVGTSTLMGNVGRHFEERGTDVVYFHCSGDPDSLDAVYAPDADFLVLDGTAPHIVDPRLPGARDGILNLGACLNEGQLAAQAEEIAALCRDISALFAQAYRYLAAAKDCRDDAGAVYEAAFADRDRHALLRELRERMPRQEETGGEKHAFAQAVTWKGVLQEMDSVLTDRAVCLDVPWGFDVDGLLRPLMMEAAWEGRPRAAYHDPLDAARLNHLVIGEVAFTTAVLLDAPVFRPQLDKNALRIGASRLSFDRACYELLLNQAVEALADAKQKHDALERYYIDAMDYARLNEIKEAFFRTLPA